MSDVQEELRAARAALQEADEKLREYSDLLESGQALLANPLAAQLDPAALAELEKDVQDSLELVQRQLTRCKELRDVTIPALEVQQPEYLQHASGWFTYGELLQAHLGLLGVAAVPPDEPEPDDEDWERALAERPEFSFLVKYIEWAKTVRYPKGELDLSTWPHTLPDPPVEPFDAEERLKALLNDPDGEARAFGRVALGALANARAVRDYKGQRTLN